MSSASFIIRRYRPGDHSAIGRIFHEAVHQLASRDYTPEQIHAWATPPGDRAAWELHWRQRCERKNPFVAETGGEIAGFIELDPEGHIDCTYVDPRHARRGLMSALMEEVKGEAQRHGIPLLFAEVSITARPFFERHGFQVTRENFVTRHGVVLMNFIMECPLAEL